MPYDFVIQGTSNYCPSQNLKYVMEKISQIVNILQGKQENNAEGKVAQKGFCRGVDSNWTKDVEKAKFNCVDVHFHSNRMQLYELVHTAT